MCTLARVCPLPSPLLSLVRYTWEIYARRLLDLSSVYSFWKHVSNLERSETKRYLELLYVLRLRPLIEKVGCACVGGGDDVRAAIHVGGLTSRASHCACCSNAIVWSWVALFLLSFSCF